MPARRRDRRTFAILAIALAIFGAVAASMAVALERTAAAVAWVDHTHAVIEALGDVVDGLGRAESARRGHALSHDPAERARFDDAESDVNQSLAALRALVADNATQIEREADLDAAVHEQLARQREALDRPDVANLTELAQHSRVLASGMVAAERHLLATREALRAGLYRRTAVVASAAAVLAGSLVTLAFVRVQREVNARRRGENEARAAKERAEMIASELDSFAYAVAHDLRGPLRGIDGFSRALLEDAATRLDEADREHLSRVRKAAQRMSELIEDLLRLSRITSSHMVDEDLDLAQLARDVVTELEQRSPERKVTVRIPPSLPVRGDRRLLRVLLENLLGNAWKFTSKRENPEIELGVEDGACFVRDNGAGFDMRYVDRLFTAFQRLHDARDYPGSGIGLATSQRVVRRHGGKIWAESQVDRGTTFRFTLQGITENA